MDSEWGYTGILKMRFHNGISQDKWDSDTVIIYIILDMFGSYSSNQCLHRYQIFTANPLSGSFLVGYSIYLLVRDTHTFIQFRIFPLIHPQTSKNVHTTHFRVYMQ